MHLEQLPNYAPDLPPDEGVWQYVKNVGLKNVCCRQIGVLKRDLRPAFERLRHKTDVLTECFGLAGIDL